MPPQPATPAAAGPDQAARPLELARRRWAGRLLALNVAGLLAVAVWFRLRLLGNLPGLNGDEAWYGVQALRLLGGESLEWATPTGNPLNPLFFGPLVALHWLFGPSIAVLRTVAVLSGLAALVLNWVLCRKVFGHRTAIVSTALLALLPVEIAYSRFGWDASQSVLATLPVWYLSLGALGDWQRRRWWLSASAVCLLLAMLVHPANVFAAAGPLAVAAMAWHGRRRSLGWKKVTGTICAKPGTDRRLVAGRSGKWCLSPFSARGRTAAMVALAAIVGALSFAATDWAQTPSAPIAAGRLAGPAAWLHPGALAACAALSARLLTGGTIYQYFGGSVSWLQWPAGWQSPAGTSVWGLDVLGFWAVVGASFWAIGCHVARCSAHAERALAGGCALGLVGYWLAVGPTGMVPGYERYALALVVPLVIVISRGMDLVVAGSGRAGRLAAAIGIALGWLVLADFHAHYFRFVEQTGGRAHRTFRTAAVDPKQAAAELILAHLRTKGAPPKDLPTDSPAAPQFYVVSSEWWTEWALRYFTAGDQQVRVVGPSGAAEETPPAAAVVQGRVFWVEFADSGRLEELRGRLAGPRLVQWPVRDYAGRVVLWVLYRQAETAAE